MINYIKNNKSVKFIHFLFLSMWSCVNGAFQTFDQRVGGSMLGFNIPQEKTLLLIIPNIKEQILLSCRPILF